MDKDQREYIFKLVQKEIQRLDMLKYDLNPDCDPDCDSKDLKKVFNEINFCTSILITLERKAHEDK